MELQTKGVEGSNHILATMLETVEEVVVRPLILQGEGQDARLVLETIKVLEVIRDTG